MAPGSSTSPLKATLTGEQIQKLSPELQKKLASGKNGNFTQADAQALYSVMALSKEDLHSALQSRDVDVNIWSNSDAKNAIEYLLQGKDAEDICDKMGYDCWFDLEQQTPTMFEDLDTNQDKIDDQRKEALMAKLKSPVEKREVKQGNTPGNSLAAAIDAGVAHRFPLKDGQTGVYYDHANPQPTLHDGKVYLSKLGELKFKSNNGDEKTLYDPEDLADFLDLKDTPSKHLSTTEVANQAHIGLALGDDVKIDRSVSVNPEDFRYGFSVEEYCLNLQYTDEEYGKYLECLAKQETLQKEQATRTALHAVYSEHVVKTFGRLARAQSANKNLPAAKVVKTPKAPLYQRDTTATQPQLDTVNPGDLPQPVMWGIIGGVGVVLVVMLVAFTGFKAGRRNRQARKEQAKESA